jgi:3-oxoadipate enol-lactonase
MPRVEVFGGNLHYETSGSRGSPPVLLLHALGSSLSMWDPQMEALEREHFVVRYSIRGHGESTIERFCELDIDALANDALAVLDAVGVERAHWCGLSLGGMTAMHAAVHSTARVDRLVLANTAAYLPPPELWTSRLEAARKDGVSSLVPVVMGRWFTARFREESPDAVARIAAIMAATDSAGYAAACAAIRHMDQRESIRRITAPTLVIAGEHDPGTTLEHAAELVRAIPGARQQDLPAAHLSNIECVEAFTAALLEHFGRQ